jgi:DcmR-like sensory protein
MREHGLVQSAADLGLHGHACWTYDHEAELIRGAAEFLADGVRLGQRLIYVSAGPLDLLHARVEEMGRDHRMVAEGTVEILSLDAMFEAAPDPDALLTVFATATDQALADGFTGLRVVGDATALVKDATNWPAHLRWEAAADKYMATKPYSGLCCYDRRVLPHQMLQDLCAMHPVAHAPAGEVPFRLYAERDALMLEGEVDFFATGGLRRALDATLTNGAPLDLSRTEFVDHHAAVLLAERGVPVRGIPYSMRRACELLGLTT